MIAETIGKAVSGLLLISIFTPGFSQNVEKRYYQTKNTVTAPLIDGKMNDECWNLTEWSGDFIQTSPEENKPPTQKTAFKVLFDNDNLYVIIKAYDTEPDKISRLMSRRDYFNGDMVSVSIDSYFDKQTAFLFNASASGTKNDAAITMDGNNEDDSWNPIWYLKTSVDAEGWLAEMKIPLSQLRFGKKSEQIWGFQVNRTIYRNQERSVWQYIPKGSPGSIHLYGELMGIKDIKPKHQAEIMPYGLAKMERFAQVEGNPFQTGKLSGFSGGLDGKIGLTNDFTIDFTINPDFGQVEADPSEVNLTAFESYFSEQRPFFVEGKSIYQFYPNQSIVIQNMSTDNLFYSRRIGRYPHGYPSTDANEYVKMPEATTILGAMKISGKTKKGLSIGILESVTSREDAVIDSAGVRSKVTVEPLTNYFVGRVQQELNKGKTVFGGIITAVNRDINTPLLDNIHKSAYTAGVDFQHNWKERTWYVAGNAEVSKVNGKPAALIATQLSSARYYQRPDSKYLSVDSTLTSLSGAGGTLKFGKSSQKKLQFETSITLRSPGLEFNDIGYMRYSDVIHHGTWVGYYLRNPFSIFNNFYLNTNYWVYWDFSGKLLSTNTNVNFNSQFKNRWRMNGNFNRQSENISTRLLRGGESFINPGNQSFNFNLGSDGSKKFSFNIGNYHGFGDRRSFRGHSYWLGIEYNPFNSLAISFEPEFSTENYELQFVSKEGTDLNPVYLFARLDQKTMNFTFRLNYTINPELSLEYYGQPFISSGKYSNYKQITQPAADIYSDRYHNLTNTEIAFDAASNIYGIDNNSDGSNEFFISNPDFNFRQFRSNMVLRWEYLPGSTFYVVWSQGRTSSASDGTFAYGNDMRDLFVTRPHNVFLLKLSYWFSL